MAFLKWQNDWGRSVFPSNFWSFNFIYVKGLPLHFDSKTFTGFENTDLESWSYSFLLLSCSKKENFWRGPTFKIFNFKPNEGFPTKLKWQALDIYEIEWPKVGGFTSTLYHFHSFLKGNFTIWLFNGVQILLSISV